MKTDKEIEKENRKGEQFQTARPGHESAVNEKKRFSLHFHFGAFPSEQLILCHVYRLSGLETWKCYLYLFLYQLCRF